jgi:hypothetical protein
MSCSRAKGLTNRSHTAATAVKQSYVIVTAKTTMVYYFRPGLYSRLTHVTVCAREYSIQGANNTVAYLHISS